MTMAAKVRLWGRTIGAIAYKKGSKAAIFQYAPAFIGSAIELAPLMMPLSRELYRFPKLSWQSFHGLPGMLADSLPDNFGNTIINAWLATDGRPPNSLNPVERLCFAGSRGMGALEFLPTIGPRSRTSTRISIDKLVELVSEILAHRSNLEVSFSGKKKGEALRDILHVSTSAAGARAKAIIAWNRETNEVRSGQAKAGESFTYWVLKFDGIRGNRDKELDDPPGYGAIEYAYHRMAVDAGIEMAECRLLEENGRRHFMTRRFDRRSDGGKLHMQSLGALAHFDYNQPGVFAYEDAFLTIRQLDLGPGAAEEQFRRMVFNIIGRNQDDHVKNIAFLMDDKGDWALSPAFDLTYSFNPAGDFTSSHQMTMNGKQDDFILEDFKSCAKFALMKRGRAETIIEEVRSVVSQWRNYADDVGVDTVHRDKIQNALRLHAF